jgi:hypothetical protein
MSKLVALLWTEDRAYFFRGDQYVRYSVGADAVDSGYPQPISSGWKGVFTQDIDAAAVWNNGRAYFFKGSEYCAYDVVADLAVEGYPKSIGENWPGVFASGIDAVLPWGDGKAYFFSGDQYLRYDMATDTVDEGYPKPIADGWAHYFTEDVDSAVRWPNGKAYFFKGDQYLAFDIARDVVDAGYPVAVGEWPGPLAVVGETAPVAGDTTGGSAADDSLSARRAKIIDELLPAVLPSKYNDQKFQKLTGGLTKDNPNVTPGYTTCGSLPAYVATALGDSGNPRIQGTFGVRVAGMQRGGWVEAGGDARPKPGDLYVLLTSGATDRANGGISHVGVIVDASTDEWRTADAGQGDGWAADYVTREYDPVAGTLSGEIVATTGPRPARVLAGWIDVDLYPFP